MQFLLLLLHVAWTLILLKFSSESSRSWCLYNLFTGDSCLISSSLLAWISLLKKFVKCFTCSIYMNACIYWLCLEMDLSTTFWHFGLCRTYRLIYCSSVKYMKRSMSASWARLLIFSPSQVMQWHIALCTCNVLETWRGVNKASGRLCFSL